MYNASNMEIEKYKGFRIVKFHYLETLSLDCKTKILYRVTKNHTRYRYVDFSSKKEAKEFINNYENYKKDSLIYLKKIHQIEKIIHRLNIEKEDLIKFIDPNFLQLRG